VTAFKYGGVYSQIMGVGIEEYLYFRGWRRNPVTVDSSALAVGDWPFALLQPF
jgi:hypothetical protein